MWQIKTFDDLTTRELFEIYKLRCQTFVVDQQRIYQEVDDVDLTAVHLFKVQDGKIVAYARVFPEGQHVTFGRVVTAKSVRGSGMGRQLMDQILNVIQTRFAQQQISIEAQVQVAGFYQQFAFQKFGQPFIFNTTPHIKMTHDPLSA